MGGDIGAYESSKWISSGPEERVHRFGQAAACRFFAVFTHRLGEGS